MYLNNRYLPGILGLAGVLIAACGGSAPSEAPTSIPPTQVIATPTPPIATPTPVPPTPTPTPTPTPNPSPTVVSAPTLNPGLSTLTVEQLIDGKTVARSFIIHAPSNVDPNRSYPIVMAFHGFGGWAGTWQGKLSRLIESGDFIGIYPFGTGAIPAWNVGNGVSTVDDLEYVEKIIDVLEEYEQLDLSKMYAVGTSMGAGLVQILAGQTDYFSGGAAIVTQLQIGWEPQASIGPVSILQISGMQDSTIPYDGGKIEVGNFHPAEESAQIWAEHNMCNATPTITSTGEGNRKIVYSGCVNGTQVVHYGITNGPHVLPLNTEGGLYDLVWSFFDGLTAE